ncbi:MAG TPA: copper homeostasis membrane protein CopD [Stellaceae bacterium]|nr:copper homeostasis membrane protein CopD [Stellaceae bacterium]
MAEALIASRLVQFVTVMALFGTALFPYYAGTGRSPTGFGRIPSRWLAGLALLSALAWLLCEAASMGDGWAAVIDGEIIRTVLLDTEFGHVWLVRLALCAGLLAGLWWPGTSQLPSMMLSGLLLASLAGTGHAAMDDGIPGLAHRANQVTHLLAAGIWLGGLLPLAGLVGRSLATGRTELATIALRRFSRVGYGAVALLILTGAVNSWFLVGTWRNLSATDYGRLLLVKLALFTAMVVLATVNRFRLLPRLTTPRVDTLVDFRRTIAAELMLGLLILAVISVLGTWAPAGYGPAS